MNVEDKEKIFSICQNHRWEILGDKIKMVYIKSFNPNKFEFESGIEALISEKWENLIDQRKKKGLNLPTNGEIFQCFGYDVDMDNSEQTSVGLHLGITDYMHYIGIRKSGKRIWSIGTAGITYFRTGSQGERHYVFAIRNKNAANIGGTLENPPAGYLDREVIPKNLENNCGEHTEDIFKKNLKKESKEELGLSKNKIKNISILNLSRIGDYYNPFLNEVQEFNDTTILYSIEADTYAEEVMRGFKKSKKYGGEHSEHFIIPEHDLVNFISQRKELLTPKTKMSLIYLLTDSFIKNE